MARVFEGAYAERWVLTGLYAVLPDTLGCCHIENGCSTFFLTNPASCCHTGPMQRRALRYLKYLVAPLVLISWLGAVWACAGPQGHHPTHEGQACTVVHSAIGLQAPAKLASVAAVVPVVIVAFLTMMIVLVGFFSPSTDAVPLSQRHRYSPAQPNAPPVLAFVS